MHRSGPVAGASEVEQSIAKQQPQPECESLLSYDYLTRRQTQTREHPQREGVLISGDFNMRLSAILLTIGAVFLFVAVGPCQGRKRKNRWNHELEYYPKIEPQFCTTKYKVKKLGYPDSCSASWCNSWWSWWMTSCCYYPVYTVTEVEEKVCCCGYWGRNCDRPVCSMSCSEGETCVAPDTCGPIVLCESACLNGGTCTGLEKCTCAPGFTGTYCENTITDFCSPPCLNGGKCYRGVCQCPDLYTGPNCAIFSPGPGTESGPEPGFLCNPECQNGGTCVGHNECTCLPEFTGDICETSLAGCDPPCLNGGVCKEGKCECPPDFTGSACEMLADYQP